MKKKTFKEYSVDNLFIIIISLILILVSILTPFVFVIRDNYIYFFIGFSVLILIHFINRKYGISFKNEKEDVEVDELEDENEELKESSIFAWKIINQILNYAGNYDMRKAIAEHREEYESYLDECIKTNKKVNVYNFNYWHFKGVDSYLCRIRNILRNNNLCNRFDELHKEDFFIEHINDLGNKILQKLKKVDDLNNNKTEYYKGCKNNFENNSEENYINEQLNLTGNKLKVLGKKK